MPYADVKAGEVLCVMILSRTGNVLLNYWPDSASPAKPHCPADWDTPSAAKLVVGHQVLLRFPDASELRIGTAAFHCSVANGAYCSVAIMSHHRSASTSREALATVAAHLANTFEIDHRDTLTAQATLDDAQRRRDEGMTSAEVLADTATLDPRHPPTLSTYLPFEDNVRQVLLGGVTIHSITSKTLGPGILLSAAVNLGTGRPICCVTNPVMVPVPLAASAAEVAGTTTFPDEFTAEDWYTLRGLYLPVEGVLWEVLLGMCAGVESGAVVEMVDREGWRVECLVRVVRTVHCGAPLSAAVVAFLAGSEVAQEEGSVIMTRATAFRLRFPLRSVARSALTAATCPAHARFLVHTHSLEDLPTSPFEIGGSARGLGDSCSTAYTPKGAPDSQNPLVAR